MRIPRARTGADQPAALAESVSDCHVPVVQRSFRPAVVLAVAVLAGLNVFLAYWRGTHSFNFSDSSYLLENLHRMMDGEVPYRDFFLSLAPAHHYGCALVWWLWGDQAFYLIVYAALLQGIVCVLCYTACQQLDDRPWLSVLAASLVTVGGTATTGFPLYDTDGGLVFILLVNVLLAWERTGYGGGIGFTAGLLAGLVVLVKLNMGIPLLVGLLVMLLLASIVSPRSPVKRAGSAVIVGVTVCLLAFVGWLAWNHALEAFIDQNVRFPFQERLSFFHTLEETYGLGWLLRREPGWPHYQCWWILVLAGTVLCAAGLRKGTRRPIARLLPIMTMAFTLGTFLSHAGYSSTYGIYPAAALLLFQMHGLVRSLLGATRERLATCVIVALAAAFLATGAVAMAQGDQLAFLRRPLDDPAPFHIAQLRGLSATRPYRDSFEQLVAAVDETVPPDEPFYYFPGDQPIYYVMGRRCPLPNVLVQRAAGWPPESAMQAIYQARVRWLIVRRAPDQSIHVPNVANTPGLMPWLRQHYNVVRALPHFLICRRKQK